MKITVTLPQAGHLARQGLSIIGLYLDDSLIGTASLGVDTNTHGSALQYIWEPIVVKGSVFNVRPRTHKVSIGLKSTNSVFNADRPFNFLDAKTPNNMNNIEQRIMMFINISIEGEVMRYIDY